MALLWVVVLFAFPAVSRQKHKVLLQRIAAASAKPSASAVSPSADISGWLPEFDRGAIQSALSKVESSSGESSASADSSASAFSFLVASSATHRDLPPVPTRHELLHKLHQKCSPRCAAAQRCVLLRSASSEGGNRPPLLCCCAASLTPIPGEEVTRKPTPAALAAADLPPAPDASLPAQSSAKAAPSAAAAPSSSPGVSSKPSAKASPPASSSASAAGKKVVSSAGGANTASREGRAESAASMAAQLLLQRREKLLVQERERRQQLLLKSPLVPKGGRRGVSAFNSSPQLASEVPLSESAAAAAFCRQLLQMLGGSHQPEAAVLREDVGVSAAFAERCTDSRGCALLRPVLPFKTLRRRCVFRCRRRLCEVCFR